ncbi:MAG: hypothetical protein H7039_09470 [Bryobacteraceae bacterium]|nr:hypothetical protein [Bryobacteraceae bacterium]
MQNQNAAALLRSRTTSVDEQVTYAFRSQLASVFPRGMAIVAVGGYGRRELFPSSDVDLLLLVDKELHSDEQRQALSAFLRSLWDVGQRLSQSVRTVAECTRFDPTNIELAISLLDARFLIGDSDLYDQLADRCVKYFRSHRHTLAEKLCELTATRHAKFGNTISHLEPNVKEGPGGLRDLHVSLWLARLREVPPPTDPALESAKNFIWELRCVLHSRTARDSNVLTFDHQEEMAADPAAWMREYYRHAKTIYRQTQAAIETCESLAATGLVRSFRDWRSRLSNAELTVVRDRVMLRGPGNLDTDRGLLFRLFEFVGRHGIPVSLDTERRIQQMLLNGSAPLNATPVWPDLKTIFAQPHAALALQEMSETGVLPSLFPAWRSIDCLVVRDFYHRYTVDEHTLVAIGHLDKLRSGTDPSHRRFSEMLGETPDIPLLVTALIFHDVGKSDGLTGHAKASAQAAEADLRTIGVPDDERATILFLIEHHLEISATMNSRDLADPATAAELANRVQTLEKLRSLTLLTYADISAVNPEAMTPWRLEQLWHAYLAGHRELTRELESARIHVTETPSSDGRSGWMEGFPIRYLRTHSDSQIEQHLQLAREAAGGGLGLDLSKRSGAWHLTVVTSDRPGLLAGLAGTVSSFGMNIVRAEAFSNTGGLVLDSITFEDPMRTLELNPPEQDRLRQIVRKVVFGKEDVGRLLRGRPRPAAPAKAARILPAVFFDNEASSAATLVEIVAEDRPGLFYELAQTFSSAGCSIEVVLIDTEAHKAIDVFYVTCQNAKLNPDIQRQLQSELLRVCHA